MAGIRKARRHMRAPPCVPHSEAHRLTADMTAGSRVPDVHSARFRVSDYVQAN